MNRILNLLLIPIGLFLAVGVVWFSIVLFLGSASFIADLMKGFFQSIFLELPKELLALLSDPWKILALPFAVGVVIFFYQWLFGRFFDHQDPPFIRGRRLGDREQRPRRRPDHPRSFERNSDRDRPDRF
jgi:hypothetical protein